METNLVPACAYSLGGERAHQRNNGAHQHFSLRESCPFRLLPEASHFSYFHVPWHFSSCLLSTGAHSKGIPQRVSPYMGPIRGCLGLQPPFISPGQEEFQARCCESSLSGTGAFGWGAWSGAETLCSLEDTLQPRYLL